MKHLTIPVLVVLLTGPAVFALGRSGRVHGHTTGSQVEAAVYGVGVSSCKTWTEARVAHKAGKKEDVRFWQFEAFLHGYTSAYNILAAPGGNVLGKTDAAGTYAFIDKFCGEHPTVLFNSAVGVLIRHLDPGR